MTVGTHRLKSRKRSMRRCPSNVRLRRQVVEDHLDQQFQTEIPRQPIIRKFTIHCGRCQSVATPARRHPLQTSAATGPHKANSGDAQAAIVDLNKRAACPRKIADTFQNSSASRYPWRLPKWFCARPPPSTRTNRSGTIQSAEHLAG